jgi:hypothetical protein
LANFEANLKKVFTEKEIIEGTIPSINGFAREIDSLFQTISIATYHSENALDFQLSTHQFFV